MKFLVPLALLLAACGRIDHVVTGEVQIKLQLDVANLEKYFRARCLARLGDVHPSQINQCAREEMADFLAFFPELVKTLEPDTLIGAQFDN
jgi:hypothetical protein